MKKKKNKITLTEFRKAQKEEYFSANGKCRNCGAPIYQYKDINFAHWRSKNSSGCTKIQKIKDQSLVCEVLHKLDHNTAAKNLLNEPCVKLFVSNYGTWSGDKWISDKRFWQNFVEEKYFPGRFLLNVN